MSDKRLSAPALAQMKRAGQKIVCLTAYDYPTARLVDAAGVDMALVGDSLGNVVLGYSNTLPVTMEEMLHHAKAVSRGLSRAMLVVDMPFMSYQPGRQMALENAGRFIKEAGAQGVKLEGGAAVADRVADMVSAGIPVLGHLGMTPQSVHVFGGYVKQAKSPQSQEALVADAQLLQRAGAFGIVLELIPPAAAARVTEAVDIPTIGIGAGPDCDGQVLVVNDMLGMDERFSPKHSRQYAQLHEVMRSAFSEYAADVRGGRFPER